MVWVLMYVSGLLSVASGATESYEEASSSMSPMTHGSGSDASSCIGVKDPAMTADALKKISAEYLAGCLALLGKDRMQEDQAAQIWNRLLEVTKQKPYPNDT